MKATVDEAVKATVEGTTLKIDLGDLVNALDADSKRTLARMLAFDEQLLLAITGVAADGIMFEEDDGRWWSIGGEFATNLRLKLQALMPEATRELVRDLVQQRDQARALQDQQREDYWKLWHAFPREALRLRPEPSREYPHVDKMSEGEADAVIAGETKP